MQALLLVAVKRAGPTLVVDVHWHQTNDQVIRDGATEVLRLDRDGRIGNAATLEITIVTASYTHPRE